MFERETLGNDRMGAVIEGHRTQGPDIYSWAAWRLHERASGVCPTKLDALTAASAFLGLDTD